MCHRFFESDIIYVGSLTKLLKYVLIEFDYVYNFSGFAIYIYGPLHIVSVSSLLVLPIECIHRRYWMLRSDLW